jgi:hypothetical protein
MPVRYITFDERLIKLWRGPVLSPIYLSRGSKAEHEKRFRICVLVGKIAMATIPNINATEMIEAVSKTLTRVGRPKSRVQTQTRSVRAQIVADPR